MSLEENKTVARRFFEEVWNQGNLAALDELASPDLVAYNAGHPEPVHGRESTYQRVASYRAALPDIHFTPEDMIAEGDKVVSRWRVEATHQGDFMGVAASGRRVTVTGITIIASLEARSWRVGSTGIPVASYSKLEQSRRRNKAENLHTGIINASSSRG